MHLLLRCAGQSRSRWLKLGNTENETVEVICYKEPAVLQLLNNEDLRASRPVT